MHVTKASGEQMVFLPDKLKHSLESAGASPVVSSEILAAILRDSYEGIPTGKIYRHAFRLLKQYPGSQAAKYKLKQAIMELGPTGFPFEQFIAEILRAKGYQVRTGQVLEGKCVTHEVDVVAEKAGEQLFGECKFHNKPGLKCDVKIPLYVDARFRDIRTHLGEQKIRSGKKLQGWVITNTHFSADAIQYGICAGLHLLGWDYPSGGENLKSSIDRLGLHPLTCLTSLRNAEKQYLLDHRIVLANQLPGYAGLASIPGMTPTRADQLLAEVKALCTPSGNFADSQGTMPGKSPRKGN